MEGIFLFFSLLLVCVCLCGEPGARWVTNCSDSAAAYILYNNDDKWIEWLQSFWYEWWLEWAICHMLGARAGNLRFACANLRIAWCCVTHTWEFRQGRRQHTQLLTWREKEEREINYYEKCKIWVTVAIPHEIKLRLIGALLYLISGVCAFFFLLFSLLFISVQVFDLFWWHHPVSFACKTWRSVWRASFMNMIMFHARRQQKKITHTNCVWSQPVDGRTPHHVIYLRI